MPTSGISVALNSIIGSKRAFGHFFSIKCNTIKKALDDNFPQKIKSVFKIKICSSIIQYLMKITNIFKEKRQTFSFEFFPPKSEAAMNALLDTIENLKLFYPDYVSVTYGAMGTTRDKTIAIIR